MKTLDFNSPLEAFLNWEATTPNRLFLKQPLNGRVLQWTYNEAGQEIRKMASKLQSYDFKGGSHIALLSKNCAHWIMSDLAIAMVNLVSIPIYPTLNAESINQILEHSDSKAIIVGKLDNFESQRSGIPDIPVIVMDMYGISEGESWTSILKNNLPLEDLQMPSKEDLHTIIYTSGTTGTAKGVMHTVGNFMETASAITSNVPFPKYPPALFSYLPLAHVAERLGIAMSAITLGGNISFAESLDTFASDLEATQPDIFFAVPRIWEKFKEKILEKLPQKKLNVLLSIPLINKIIKKKLKHKLGLSNALFICSGAAPIAVNIMKWYRRLDIEICQGYGMTEDCILSHFNLPGQNKIGTVGKTIGTVKAKFSAEGEILIKNNCLMKGYYKSPEQTAEVFTTDGYLKTGDIGEYDHEGYLTITGRIKDQFKTDKGKYISPAPIELEVSKNQNIEQICIVGTGIPQPIALVTLSELGKGTARDKLVTSLQNSVNLVNPELEKHEQLQKVIVMKEDWTVDNGLTTPTLKVKRNSIEKIHQPYYRNWFEMKDTVIFEEA